MSYPSLSAKKVVLISILLFLSFHALSRSQKTRWHNLLHDPHSSIPFRLNNNQKAYIAYISENKEDALTWRNNSLSGSVEQHYNLGTAYAQRSVSSGEVTDLTWLQTAEQLLSGAASLDTTTNQEIIHNLETVRRLLQKAQEQEQTQQNQQSSWSGDQQQQEQQSWWSQEEQQWQQSAPWSEADWSSQDTQTSTLSESMKQQLIQYQKQLEGEQMQNQQFFDKQSPQANQNDPFDMLNQVFGWQPQFDEQWNSWWKDW